MFQIVLVEAFVVRSISPGIDPFAVFLTLVEVALVLLAIFIVDEAIGIELIVIEDAIVFVLWGYVLALSVLLSVQELALVVGGSGLPLLFAIAVGQVS